MEFYNLTIFEKFKKKISKFIIIQLAYSMAVLF